MSWKVGAGTKPLEPFSVPFVPIKVSSVANFLEPASLFVPLVLPVYTSPANQPLPAQSRVYALERALTFLPLPAICI